MYGLVKNNCINIIDYNGLERVNIYGVYEMILYGNDPYFIPDPYNGFKRYPDNPEFQPSTGANHFGVSTNGSSMSFQLEAGIDIPFVNLGVGTTCDYITKYDRHGCPCNK